MCFFCCTKHIRVVHAKFAFSTHFSDYFRPWQLATYFFMHGNLAHIFFNMFALVIFGSQLERVWGPQKFLFFYLSCAIGAALIHMLVGYIRLSSFEASIDPILLQDYLFYVQDEGYNLLTEGKNYIDPTLGKLNALYNTPMVGASGAIFGLLVGFGFLFPNTELMLLFPPIPIKQNILSLDMRQSNYIWDAKFTK